MMYNYSQVLSLYDIRITIKRKTLYMLNITIKVFDLEERS